MSTLAPPWRIATAGATSNTCPASVLCLPCCAVCRTAQKGCPLAPSCLVSAHSRCHSDLVRNALQSCPVHAQACPAPAAYTPRQCQAQHPSFQPLLKLLALTCISCHCFFFIARPCLPLQIATCLLTQPGPAYTRAAASGRYPMLLAVCTGAAAAMAQRERGGISPRGGYEAVCVCEKSQVKRGAKPQG